MFIICPLSGWVELLIAAQVLPSAAHFPSTPPQIPHSVKSGCALSTIHTVFTFPKNGCLPNQSSA